MALSAVSTTFFSQTKHRLDVFFTLLGQRYDAFTDIMARRNLIESLYNKTDADLAKMELKREDIPRYVFKDLLDSQQ